MNIFMSESQFENIEMGFARKVLASQYPEGFSDCWNDFDDGKIGIYVLMGYQKLSIYITLEKDEHGRDCFVVEKNFQSVRYIVSQIYREEFSNAIPKLPKGTDISAIDLKTYPKVKCTDWLSLRKEILHDFPFLSFGDYFDFMFYKVTPYAYKRNDIKRLNDYLKNLRNTQ